MDETVRKGDHFYLRLTIDDYEQQIKRVFAKAGQGVPTLSNELTAKEEVGRTKVNSEQSSPLKI